jgi:prepilin-type N-terminal cleavage/methylation domain-containing protein
MLDLTARVNPKVRLSLGSRNRSGFTMVEVLVVALIVAALAAVSIPVYSGYIRTQKIEVVSGLAQTASVAANIYFRRTGAGPTTAVQLNLFYDAAKFDIVFADPQVTVTDKSDVTITKTINYR